MGHWGKQLGRVAFYGHPVAEPGQCLDQWGRVLRALTPHSPTLPGPL